MPLLLLLSLLSMERMAGPFRFFEVSDISCETLVLSTLQLVQDVLREHSCGPILCIHTVASLLSQDLWMDTLQQWRVLLPRVSILSRSFESIFETLPLTWREWRCWALMIQQTFSGMSSNPDGTLGIKISIGERRVRLDLKELNEMNIEEKIFIPLHFVDPILRDQERPWTYFLVCQDLKTSSI